MSNDDDDDNDDDDTAATTRQELTPTPWNRNLLLPCQTGSRIGTNSYPVKQELTPTRWDRNLPIKWHNMVATGIQQIFLVHAQGGRWVQ